MTILIVVLIVAALLLFGYLYGSRHFIVKHETISFKDLPTAFDGYRIVQFSDFHAGSFHMGHDEDVDKVVEMINAQNPDLIVFTGDLVIRSAKELDGFIEALSRLKAKDGVYSVMGNHDYGQYNREWTLAQRRADIKLLHQRQKEMGWKLLLNEHDIIHRGGDSIAIIGIENDGTPPHFPQYGNLSQAMCGLTQNGKDTLTAEQPSAGEFKILLSHDPTSWRRHVLPDSDIQLTLSGHTHAGQFEVFGLSMTRWIYEEWSGLYRREDGRTLYISNGVGCVPFPYRIGAWPEINVIELNKN